jgi:hypothetical protein
MALVASLIVVVTVVGACGRIGTAGSGPAVTETRQVGAFSAVDVNSGIDAAITIGEAGPLAISAESNILPLIETTVEDGVLIIRSTDSFSSQAGVHVEVGTPSLDAINLNGGAEARIDGLAAGSFAVEQNGGSALTATGSTDTLTVASNGGSQSNLEDLAATVVSVDVSGGSRVTVNASDSVSGTANGGSHVTVRGDASVDVSANGGAEVTTE